MYTKSSEVIEYLKSRSLVNTPKIKSLLSNLGVEESILFQTSDFYIQLDASSYISSNIAEFSIITWTELKLICNNVLDSKIQPFSIRVSNHNFFLFLNIEEHFSKHIAPRYSCRPEGGRRCLIEPIVSRLATQEEINIFKAMFIEQGISFDLESRTIRYWKDNLQLGETIIVKDPTTSKYTTDIFLGYSSDSKSPIVGKQGTYKKALPYKTYEFIIQDCNTKS